MTGAPTEGARLSLNRGPSVQIDPIRVRRILSLVAAVALIPEAQELWKAAVAPSTVLRGHALAPSAVHAILLILAVGAFAALLLAAALVLGAGSVHTIARVDLALLLTGILLVVGEYVLSHEVNDEGALTARAAQALIHGQPVYGSPWPGIFTTVPVTKTMSGGAVYQYDYPPLSVLLTAALDLVLRHAGTAATVVTMTAFLLTAVVLWHRIDPVWRPLVIVVMFSFDQLAGSARAGSPVVIAIALLIPAVLHFDRTGSNGRLGLTGALRAGCVGAACSAQQLAWFVVPFLLVALYTLRANDLGHRRAAVLVIRFALIAAAVAAALDLPFLLTQPTAWLHGILLPLTQHAIVHGQGLVDVPYLLTDGSGALDLFSAATVALLIGFVAAAVLLPVQVGPAMTLLPIAAFIVATRCDFAYWMQFSPVWFATAVTVPRCRFQRTWQPQAVRRLSARRRGVLAAALLLPAVLLALGAAFSPAPLRLALQKAIPAPGSRSELAVVELVAENRSGHPVQPHFASVVNGGASGWWAVLHGPAVLLPGQRAAYALEPGREQQRFLPGMRIIAVSDGPMTISSLRLPSTLTSS